MTQSYLRARYYDPSIGRFISEDPVKDGANWYVYCANDPVNAWDPSGLKLQGEVIGFGSRNQQDIKQIQSHLNSLGYVGADGKTLTIDGYFGENTLYAVKNYQQENGLDVDGMVGDITWAKMGFKNSDNESSIVAPVKIDPNNWEDYYNNDDNYTKKDPMRGSYSKQRERKQINDAFGKDRAAREGQSQDLHDSKKGKRNDDNSSYGQLKNGNYWSEAIIGVGAAVVSGIIYIMSSGMYVPQF